MPRIKIHPENYSQVDINKANRAALRARGGRILSLRLEKSDADNLAKIRRSKPEYRTDAAVISKLLALMAEKL